MAADGHVEMYMRCRRRERPVDIDEIYRFSFVISFWEFFVRKKNNIHISLIPLSYSILDKSTIWLTPSPVPSSHISLFRTATNDKMDKCSKKSPFSFILIFLYQDHHHCRQMGQQCWTETPSHSSHRCRVHQTVSHRQLQIPAAAHQCQCPAPPQLLHWSRHKTTFHPSPSRHIPNFYTSHRSCLTEHFEHIQHISASSSKSMRHDYRQHRRETHQIHQRQTF